MGKEEWIRRKNSSPVRIQWDPERNLHLEPLPYRSIQIGLSIEAVHRYVSQWIRKITDITHIAHSLCALISENKLDEARAMLPQEIIHALDEQVSTRTATVAKSELHGGTVLCCSGSTIIFTRLH